MTDFKKVCQKNNLSRTLLSLDYKGMHVGLLIIQHVINAGGLLVTGVLIKNYLVGFMILQIKIEFVAMEFVIFVQEILVTKAQIVVVITLIGIRKTLISSDKT